MVTLLSCGMPRALLIVAAKPATISKALGIPQLSNVTIPCDHGVADRAVNEGVPFVLWDDGPLGTGMKKLAGLYDPRANAWAAKGKQGNGLLSKLTTQMFRSA